MHKQSSSPAASEVSPPALVHRRGLNASLQTIAAGLQPIGKIVASDRTYFRFRNGQIRRQLGEGHSAFERGVRRAKRTADYAVRREYKRLRAS